MSGGQAQAQGAPMGGGKGGPQGGGKGGPQNGPQGIGGPTTGQMHQQINNPQPQGGPGPMQWGGPGPGGSGPMHWGGTPMPRPNMPGNPINTMPAMTSGGVTQQTMGQPRPMPMPTPMPNYGGGGGWARQNVPGHFPTAPAGGQQSRPGYGGRLPDGFVQGFANTPMGGILGGFK